MDINELKERAYKKRSGMPFYAVKVTHKISIRIVKMLEKYDFSPDIVTFISIISGLLAAFCFTRPTIFMLFAGVIFLEMYYVLDAVDGQYARTKNKSSLTGAYFDYLSNHIVHSVVFAGIGYGMYLLTLNRLYLFAGFSAAWGMLFMYIIYDAKYSILFNRVKRDVPEDNVGENIEDISREKGQVIKNIFVSIHKLCIYPTIMNIITIFGVLTSIYYFVSGMENFFMFKALILFYGVMINIVWGAKLVKMVWGKELG